MINIVDVEATLRRRYPNLEKVVDGVFRAIDHHGSSDYAIRYFDLNDRLLATAGELRKYQDNIISEKYFDGKTATDLRWNHYLYFVTSEMVAKQDEFRQAKAVVESDREYARKQVLLETDVERLFEPKQPKKHSQSLPVDLATIWTRRLEECGMGFALDDGVQIPKVVQRIADGDKQKAGKVLSPVAPTPAEMAAASCFIKRLSFEGFRLYPQVKDYSMGKVNLIVGSNGVGKTSLLEAIEYLYCGKNKRQGEVPSGTSIMAEMVGTAERLKTTSTTDMSRLRARHSNWYAKSELKKLTISDSFAKFNFLDTDAAVRLTVESSKERIGDDVSRLLLGAEAEKLSDRIVRVQDQIIIALKDINNDVSRRELQRHESKVRLNNLRGMPQLSDSLFAEFVVALKHLNWLQLPTDKHQAIALRENLQAAISYAQTLQQSEIKGLTGDVANVQGLRQALDAASQLHELEKACRLEAIKLEDPLRAAAIPIVVLNKLMPYAAAGYARLTRHRQELQQSVAELSAKLVGFSPLRPPAVPERIQDQPVSIAAHAASVLLEEQRKRLSDADSTLKAFENTQSDLMVLNQRLLAVAQDLLKKVPNPDHCPLCHTNFEQGQLILRMMGGAADDSEARLADMQVSVQAFAAEFAQTRAEQVVLGLLLEFVGDEHSSNVTVNQARNEISNGFVKLAAQKTEIVRLSEQLANLATNGCKEEYLKGYLAAAGVAELPSVSELEKLKQLATEKIRPLETEEQDVRDKLNKIKQECQVIATWFSIEFYESPDKLARKLSVQLRSLNFAMQAQQGLIELLGMQEGIAGKELVMQLESTQSLFIKLATAESQEAANNAALTKETQSIEVQTVAIDKAKVKAGRLAEAKSIFDELSKQSSGSELTARILRENAKEIGRTFSSIHVPNEFDINADQTGLRIIRRSTKKTIELDEMSTGQRAAFALSLFLAMNSRLENGPRVLLFDDPIAHVDDINVLSFLDHLRELAINGSRQIFFATADTRLAGLFRHKFRFLGDENFKEISLSREL